MDWFDYIDQEMRRARAGPAPGTTLADLLPTSAGWNAALSNPGGTDIPPPSGTDAPAGPDVTPPPVTPTPVIPPPDVVPPVTPPSTTPPPTSVPPPVDRAPGEPPASYANVPGFEITKLQDLSHVNDKYTPAVRVFSRALQSLGLVNGTLRETDLPAVVSYARANGMPNARVAGTDTIDFGDGLGPIDTIEDVGGANRTSFQNNQRASSSTTPTTAAPASHVAASTTSSDTLSSLLPTAVSPLGLAAPLAHAPGAAPTLATLLPHANSLMPADTPRRWLT